MNKLQVLLSRAHLWVSHHVAGDASASPQEEQHCLSPGAGAGPSSLSGSITALLLPQILLCWLHDIKPTIVQCNLLYFDLQCSAQCVAHQSQQEAVMGLAGGQWGVTKDSHAHYFTFSLYTPAAKMGPTNHNFQIKIVDNWTSRGKLQSPIHYLALHI